MSNTRYLTCTNTMQYDTHIQMDRVMCDGMPSKTLLFSLKLVSNYFRLHYEYYEEKHFRDPHNKTLTTSVFKISLIVST